MKCRVSSRSSATASIDGGSGAAEGGASFLPAGVMPVGLGPLHRGVIAVPQEPATPPLRNASTASTAARLPQRQQATTESARQQQVHLHAKQQQLAAKRQHQQQHASQRGEDSTRPLPSAAQRLLSATPQTAGDLHSARDGLNHESESFYVLLEASPAQRLFPGRYTPCVSHAINPS